MGRIGIAAIKLFSSLAIIWGVNVQSPAGAALAEQQGGRIQGRVSAVTAGARQAMSGVTVSLSGGWLQGRTLQTVSDADGQYSFGNLAAGDYTVTIELQGFERFEQKVMVPLEAVVDLNIELKPQALKEEVTVTAEADGIANGESSVPSVVTTQTLRNAPLVSERFQDALPLLPGVVRGPDGLLNLKGARASQSGILVSSLNVTDPVTGNPAIELPIEAVETVQVYTNPYSAEYGKFTGAITSIETRAGTNQWKYVITNILPRPRRRDGAIRGIESTTPRISFGGPLVKDRLFLFQSFEYRYVRTRVPSERLPELQSDTKLESFDTFTRLDYNINQLNRVTISFSVFPQKRDFYNLNSFNPQDATANFHQRGWFFALNEQAAFRKGSFLQSSFSVKQYDVDVFGNSGAPYVITPQGNTGGWFDRQNRASRRYEWLEVYNLPSWQWRGQHASKAGVNVSYTTFSGYDRSLPVRIQRADGTTSQVVEFVGSGTLARNNTEVSIFAQDKWTLNRRLTLDVGLRYDRDQIGEENNLAPRFGFAVLPTDSGRTILRGGFGVFYDKIPVGIGVFEDYQAYRVTTFAADGATIIDGPRQFRPVVEGRDFRNPRSLAWNLELDHEINPRLLARLGYAERRTTRDFLVDLEPSGGGDAQLVLSNGGDARYREFQITARYRFQEKQNLYLAYVRSQSAGDLNDFNSYFGNFRNPIIRPNEFGRQPFDAPNRLLFWGDLELPWDIRMSPVVDWRNGFPYSLLDEDQKFIGARNGGGRFPTFLSLDMQATKGVTIPFRGKKYKGRVGFKIFNITNHWNPRDVQQNIAAPDFGTFYNSVGRTFRAKFEFLKF
jgi:outer membrane receptor protein involved in Fe transport